MSQILRMRDILFARRKERHEKEYRVKLSGWSAIFCNCSGLCLRSRVFGSDLFFGSDLCGMFAFFSALEMRKKKHSPLEILFASCIHSFKQISSAFFQ